MKAPAMVFSLLLFTFPVFAAPENPALPDVRTYNELLHAVREARAASQTRIEKAVEQEKVREAWEVGKLIHEHILLNKERARYGEEVFKRLSRDLGISDRELRYMVEFSRTYPIWPHAAKLTWSEYRDLLSVNDKEERRALAEQAARENWSRPVLRREIRKIRAGDPKGVSLIPAEIPLTPLKGEVGTYRVVTAVAGPLKGSPVIDLGLSNYLEVSKKDVKRFKAGDIVHASKEGELSLIKRASESWQPLQIFSYRAYLLEVTDGDTLWALIDLGFGITTKQQLRLRGLDAAEIESAEGREAKRFVEEELKKATSLLITSSKSDKYDRYLADVFYTNRDGEQFLNNRLLEKRLAHLV